MNPIVAPVVVLLCTPLLAALLSLATTHARMLHGLNLATMTSVVVSENRPHPAGAGSRTPDRALGAGLY